MKNELAIFDFDNTITNRDTFIDFLIYFAGIKAFVWGIIKCSKDLILYKLKLLSNQKAKESLLTYFFGGLSLDKVKKIGDEYSEKRLPLILNPKAIKKIKYHQDKKDKLVIVSASPMYWFHSWAQLAGFQHIICTELEIIDNILTGQIKDNNCYGIEKVNKLRKILNLKEFDYIYAYGDSRGDMEILELANESYLKFKLIK